MNRIRFQSPLLRALRSLARAVFVAFMAIPGAGFALFAVACGDLDVSGAPTSPDVSIAEAPVLPEPAESVRPTLAEVPDPAPAVVLPPVDLPLPVREEGEIFEGEDGYESGCDFRISELRIVKSTTAHGVANRNPIRPGTAFQVGEVVWAWISVANSGDKTPVTMLWQRDGVVRSRMTLDIGKSPRWRTWSRKTLRSADVGTWTIDVIDSEGMTLDILTFEVAPKPVEVTRQSDGVLGC